MINVFAGIVVEKFPDSNIDLTKNKIFVISDSTKTALENINVPLNIKLVLNTDDDTYLPAIEEYLKRYKQLKDDITVEKIMADNSPAIFTKYTELTSEYDVYGYLIVENGDKYDVIGLSKIIGDNMEFENAESLITNSLVSVTVEKKEDTKTVLFTDGHGEAAAYVIANTALSKRYIVNTINLSQEEIKDCDLLVIYCPSADFTQQELTDIENYVVNGGNLQVYLEPRIGYPTNLCEYIKEWGIEVKPELIYEQDTNYLTRTEFTIPVLASNDYVKNIKTKIYYTNSFKLESLYSNTKGITTFDVLSSSNKADTKDLSDNLTGNIGKHNIAIVSERVRQDNSIAKLFISGSSLLFYSEDGVTNEDICSSVMDGILPIENYVDVPLKTTEATEFNVSVSDFVFLLIIILVISISLIVFAVFVWIRRRKL